MLKFPADPKVCETIDSLTKWISKRALPEKIVLFGSHARGDANQKSDIDIAVFGKECSEQEWTQLVLDIEENPFTLLKIDLIEADKVQGEFKKRINEEGRILYAKK